MKRNTISVAIALALLPSISSAASPLNGLEKLWTYNHAATGVTGQSSEIVAFDHLTNSLWVAGVQGVDVLSANTGSLLQHINTSIYGSINSVASRSATATVNFNTAPVSGSDLRPKSIAGMDYEPEYIAVSRDSSKAFVSLQEANGLGVINLNTNQAEHVIGLGTKDFSAPGNYIDPSDRDGRIELRPVNARGLYQPDGIATYDANGQYYLAIANEGTATMSLYRLAIAAVPEPSTYAMLMAGFILMGFVSYRRRRDKFRY